MVKRWTLIFLTSGCNFQCGNVMRSPYQSRSKIAVEYMKAKQHWVGMDEDVEERTVDFNLHKGSDIRKSRVTVALKDESLPYRRVKMTTSKSANDKSVVRFIVLGNAGIAYYHENMRIDGFHAAIGDKLVSLKDSIDFIVMTGNNFLDRGVQDCNDPQWEKVWFERLRVEELNVPWFTVLGDKDMLGPSAQYTLHKCKGKEEMSKYWIPLVKITFCDNATGQSVSLNTE